MYLNKYALLSYVCYKSDQTQFEVLPLTKCEEHMQEEEDEEKVVVVAKEESKAKEEVHLM
jgi:hypothetical protein